jgi:hypothetical protein
MNPRLSVMLLAGLIGLGPVQSAADDNKEDSEAALKMDIAAHDARCRGVTASQADLHRQCAAEAARLDTRKKRLEADLLGDQRGHNHWPYESETDPTAGSPEDKQHDAAAGRKVSAPSNVEGK